MRSVLPLFLALTLFTSCQAQAKNPVIVFETNLGSFSVELFADKAPLTTKNILSYVDSGFYNGVVFHRVIKGFMLQGGGFDANLTKKQVQPPVKNEATNGLKNLRGTLSMARTSNPDSATSQFFVNLVDNAYLDHRDTSVKGMGYCVFGKVVAGMDVVDKIGAVKTMCPSRSRAPCTAPLPPGMRDVPSPAVVIKGVRRK